MKYLCLAYFEVEEYEKMPKQQLEALVAQAKSYDAVLKKTGALVLHGSLNMPRDGIVIRPRGGKVSVTDGPYMETKEQVGGFFMIEAKNREDAIRIASNHPAAHLGENMGWSIEVREIGFYEDF